MKLRKICLAIAAGWFLSGNVLAAPVETSNNAETISTAKTTFMATVNKSLPFKPVKWKVVRLDNNSLIEENLKQTFVLRLKPGSYRATAQLNGIVRQQSFSIMANNDTSVVLEMK